MSGFASTLATYVGAEFVCLGAMVGFFLIDVQGQVAESGDRFESLLKQFVPLQARRLKGNEFYKEFLGHCEMARHYAKICYFAPVPPERGAGEARRRYYPRLLRVMRANPQVTFKRIIRDTEANRIWAKEMVSIFANATNFHLALLSDRGPEEEMPLALSVQVVDSSNAWLVAVSEHTDTSLYRDVAVENEILVEALNRYFDRLWSLSRVVFRPGDAVAQAHRLIFEEK